MKQPVVASHPASQRARAPGGRPGTRAHARRGGAGGSGSELQSLPIRAKRKRTAAQRGAATQAPPAKVAEAEPDDGHMGATGDGSANAGPAAAGGPKRSNSIDLLPNELQQEEQWESGEQQQQQLRQPAPQTPHLGAAGPADMSPEQGQGPENAVEAEEVSLQEQQQQQQDSQADGQGGKGKAAIMAEQQPVACRGPKRLKLSDVSGPGLRGGLCGGVSLTRVRNTARGRLRCESGSVPGGATLPWQDAALRLRLPSIATNCEFSVLGG